jgi:ADP-heptose:LPS heptosyltransferase
MIYYIIFLILSPFLLILSLFRKNKTSGNLIIQTAKIGDYVNTSIMIDALKQSDILIDQINTAFANYDNRLKNILIINEYKKSLLTKIKLAFKIFFNNYENVYIVMPNSYNLFLGQMSWAKNKVTLITYADKWYKSLLSFGMRKINHTTDDLTLDSYLKMINNNFNYNNYKKIIQKPILESNEVFINENIFSIGISLTAANKLKTIDIQTWKEVFKILDDFNANIYIFGLPNEIELLNNLTNNIDLKKSTLISLLGKIELKYLPYEISKINVYISSDTGNSYIADAMNVATINFAGPCFWKEQRPVVNSLIIKSNASCVPYSSVFKTSSEEKCKNIFTINDNQKQDIKEFITKIYKDSLSF